MSRLSRVLVDDGTVKLFEDVPAKTLEYYHGKITTKQSQDLLLAADEDGSYLVRDSESYPGAYALCLLHQGQIRQYRILPESDGRLYVQGNFRKEDAERLTYPDLDQVIQDLISQGSNNGLSGALLNYIKAPKAVYVTGEQTPTSPKGPTDSKGLETTNRPKSGVEESKPPPVPARPKSHAQQQQPQQEQQPQQQQQEQRPPPPQQQQQQRPFRVGEQVKIISNIYFLESLQRGHGGMQTGIEKKLRKPSVTKFQCSICFDTEIDQIFDCGHGACDKCSDSIDQCHLCRKTIASRTKIFV